MNGRGRRRATATRALALLATTALATLGLAPALLAAPTVSVDLAPGPVHVGDRVTADVTLRAEEPPTAEPRFPAWGETWGDVDVVSAGAVERVADGVYRQRLVLVPFATGTLKLPPRTIDVPYADHTAHAQTSAALVLEVASLLPAGDAQAAPKPPAPPEALPLGDRFWWTAGIGGALCLLAAALLLRRRRAAAAEAPGTSQPALAPLPELLAEIAALAELGAARAGEPAHTRLSLALRRFLGRTLGIHALESSTSEIRAALRQHGLPRAAASEVLDLLRACDGVKFARRAATADEMAARLDRAAAVARDLAAAMAPAPLEPSPAAPASPAARGAA